MRRPRPGSTGRIATRWARCAAFGAGLVLVCSAAADDSLPTVADRVFAEIQCARTAAGIPPLERRTVLDAVARERAAAVAARPEGQRLSGARAISEDLAQAGIELYDRAVDRTFLLKNTDPVQAVMKEWTAHPQAWHIATDPEMQGFGAASTWTPDGWRVFVVVVVRDLVLPGDVSALERETVAAINVVRRRRGLPSLIASPALATVARGHSDDMAEREVLSHRSSDNRRPHQRVAAAGIEYRSVAENVAVNRKAPDPVRQAVESWMESEGHRANILEVEFTHTGVGVAVAGDGSIYFTQLFLIEAGS